MIGRYSLANADWSTSIAHRERNLPSNNSTVETKETKVICCLEKKIKKGKK
jgi:hypothetical protein